MTSGMSPVRSTHVSHSEADTIEIGRALAARLVGGSVVLLFGDLGAGKTAFVRGLVTGAGGDPDAVSSPTFTLVQPYAGTLTVQHVDLYRIAPGDVDDLGLEELATHTSIVAIEWADRVTREFGTVTRVRIDDKGDSEREITIE